MVPRNRQAALLLMTFDDMLFALRGYKTAMATFFGRAQFEEEPCGRVFAYRYVEELAALVDAQWQAHQALAREGTICPHVFQRFEGKVIRSFRKAWLAACKAAGCPGRIPHDFRRTAVRNLIRAGIPETVAMSMTGHKTRSVFMRYDIVSEGDLDSAAQKLNAAMTGTKTGTVAESAAPNGSQAGTATTSKRAS